PTGRPEWLDMRDPNVASAVFATHGASGVQEIVDASLGECSDITELDTLINDLDNATKVHEADTKKIRKDQPLHQTWQGVLTVADGATQVVPGISVGGPLGTGYAIGGGIRTVKQLGNENWQGRLDRNYLSGARLQVKGMQVFLASERIYHRHMKVYCPVLSGYVKKFGAQISFTPVATTVTTPQPGPTAPSPSDWNQP
ncbi:MAG TPA: hypothetical protein VEA36_03425, partial [Candidatus Paceibacterota bacterium]|nr:hypothetical protein [Candidatus Paceibacterota bacterium]